MGLQQQHPQSYPRTKWGCDFTAPRVTGARGAPACARPWGPAYSQPYRLGGKEEGRAACGSCVCIRGRCRDAEEVKSNMPCSPQEASLPLKTLQTSLPGRPSSSRESDTSG